MADRDASHATHDAETIAAFVAGDLRGAEAEQARRRVAGCSSCAALQGDLVAIAAALPGLPSPVRLAPRDFRLTAADAARLRRGGGLRRLLRPFAGPAFGLARMIGPVTAALGLALVLVSTPGILPGAGLGGADPMSSSTDQRDHAASPLPVQGPAGSIGTEIAEPTEKAATPNAPPLPAAADDLGPAGWLLLVIGLALVGVRRLTRRVAGS